MKEKKSILINIFWIIVIFNLDPGGFIHSYFSPIAETLFSFGSIITAYFIFNFYYRNSAINLFKLPYVKAFAIFIVVWNIYHFGVYYGFNNASYPGIPLSILKNPGMIFKSLIVFPIIYFSTFSLNSFVRILTYSTIVIGLMFILSVITGIGLIETWNANRNVGGVNRNFMYGYGLMYFVIPMAIAMIFLNFKIKKSILLASVISFLVIILTVFRRDIIGVFEYIFIIAVIINYIEDKFWLKSVSKYLNLKTILIVSLSIFLLSVFASNFLNKTVDMTTNTLGALGIIENTQGGSNTDKTRLSLSAKFGIVKAIEENIYTGTGYDSAWFTGDGGDNKWEGSDYIFLSAFAMYGLCGLIVFFPFYIIYIKVLKSFAKFLKSRYAFLLKHKIEFWVPMVVGVAAGAEIVKNIIEYPNWFYPIGAIDNSSKFFVFFALLLGALVSVKMKFNIMSIQKNEIS